MLHRGIHVVGMLRSKIMYRQQVSQTFCHYTGLNIRTSNTSLNNSGIKFRKHDFSMNDMNKQIDQPDQTNNKQIDQLREINNNLKRIISSQEKINRSIVVVIIALWGIQLAVSLHL